MARAFGLDEDCHFEERRWSVNGRAVHHGPIDYRELCWKNGHPYARISDRERVNFWCDYHRDSGRHYMIEALKDRGVAAITISWERTTTVEIEKTNRVPILAKGLFHLGLLTPEIERKLKVSITAHERLEWATEYEEKYGV